MRNLRGFLVVSIAAMAIMLSGASISQAQGLDDQPPTAAELEQFRTDLGEMITSLNASVAKMKQHPAIRSAIAKSGKDMSQSSAAAQKQLGKLSHQELEQIHRAFSTSFPKWRETAGLMERIAEKVRGNSAGKDDVDTASAITPDNCQDAFSAAPSWTDWSATKAAAIVADGAQNVIPPPINIIATAAYVALEEGVLAAETLNNIFDRCSGDAAMATLQTSVDNVQTSVNNIQSSQTSILNAVSSSTTTLNNAITNAKTDIVNNDNSNRTLVTTAITNAQTSINNTTNSSSTAVQNAITSAQNTIVNNDNSNRTLIVNNDNANALTLNTNLTNAKNTIIANDNTNTTNIVNNDNANKTAIINNDNANKTAIINNSSANTTALNDLILRAHIEADLATEANAVKVGWYMTPTANGGKLDLVQQIVTQTLANVVAAGGSIGNAQMFLDRANADKAAGDFKSAYDNYRKAYKAAVN